jgi:hypothetical protein
LEEGERLQAEESLCDEAGSSSSESVGEDEPGCAAGGPLQVRSFAWISYRRFIFHIMRHPFPLNATHPFFSLFSVLD